MKRTLSWIPLLCLVLVPVAGMRTLAHADKPPAAPAHAPKITLEKARSIALERVPGVIKHEELEKEHGRWIYSFEIKPKGEKRKIIKEVNVDSDSGEIVSVETERG